MFWGFSPTLDLLEEISVGDKLSGDLNEINILLLGGCDARHVIKTIAQAYRYKKIFINFHIIEGCTELVARQLILLSIALERENVLGLLEKTRLFMEIYGNTLLRRQTSNYMISKAKLLIKMITDEDYLKKIMPLVDIKKMKYRERDYMEMLLKFWKNGSSNIFNISKLWDNRVRSSLGVRYDSRVGVFDWDYNMRLKDVGGSAVASQEFKHFRSTGVSFTWLETEVCRPNYTLAAGVILSGDNFTHRGYLGDIVTGPYPAYGLSCDDADMMRSSNGVNLKRATDISERNVLKMFHEILNEKSFDSEKIQGITEHDLGAVTIAPLDAIISEEMDKNNENMFQNCSPSIDIDFAKIFFHSYSSLEKYPEKLEFQNKYDILFIGNTIFSHVKPPVMNMMKENGLVIVEGCKFFLDAKKDDIKMFSKSVEDFASLNKCGFLKDFKPLDDAFAKLVVRK